MSTQIYVAACNIFSHWFRPYSAIDRKWTHVIVEISINLEEHNSDVTRGKVFIQEDAFEHVVSENNEQFF